MEVVANSFNRFFVNVGPDIAGEIPDSGSIEENLENSINKNPSLKQWMK